MFTCRPAWNVTNHSSYSRKYCECLYIVHRRRKWCLVNNSTFSLIFGKLCINGGLMFTSLVISVPRQSSGRHLWVGLVAFKMATNECMAMTYLEIVRRSQARSSTVSSSGVWGAFHTNPHLYNISGSDWANNVSFFLLYLGNRESAYQFRDEPPPLPSIHKPCLISVVFVPLVMIWIE